MLKNYIPKKVSLNVLYLVLLSFVVNKGFCQTNFRPGYYITWENDTINGLIDYRGEVRNSGFCIFKKDESSQQRRFEASDIQAYRFNDGKYYISKKMDFEGTPKQIFVEFLVNGIVNLYFYRDLNNYVYLLEDEKGNILELTNESKKEQIEGRGEVQIETHKYIDILKATMTDCNEIQNQINSAQLSHKSLINLTKDYHNYVCNDRDCIIYEKKLPLLKVHIAPILRTGFSYLSFKEGIQSRYSFDPEIFPSIGLQLNAGLPRINEKISFVFESDINKNSYHGSYQILDSYIKEYYDSYIDILSLQPSLGLKYTFPKGKVKPTIGVGLLSKIFISSDPKIIAVKEHTDGTTFTYESDDFQMVPYLAGEYFQLGCNYTVLKKTMFTDLKLSHAAKRNHGIRNAVQSVSLNAGMFIN